MTSVAFDVPAIIAKYKDIPYIISDEVTLTYRQFSDLVRQKIVDLQSNDIHEKTLVALIGKADINYLVTLFALFQVGAIAVPINPKFSGNQIVKLLSQIGCTKIICDNPEIDFVRNSGITIINWNQLSDKINDVSGLYTLKAFPINQNATVIFTSGSSGTYKPVLHTIGNHYYSAIGSNENLPVTQGDQWLLSLPLFHVGGLAIIFRTFIAGGTIVPARDGLSIEENIDYFNITHISLVATQLYRVLLLKGLTKKFKLFKAVLVGGSKIPAKLLEKALRHSIPVYTTYGSTEMSSQITTTKPGDLKGNLQSSGKLLKFCQIKINQDGEILVKGKTLFRGYIVDKSIESHRNGEGWFRTGDIGIMDKNKNLTVIGRRDNMFVSGGENIYPEEIEQVLNNIDGIAESVVVGIDEQEYGRVPIALLRIEKNRFPDEEQLKEKLSAHLPGYKIPKKFYNWPEMEEGKLKPDRVYFYNFASRLFSGD